MTSRLSEREMMRGDAQQLLHDVFNATEMIRSRLVELALVQKMDERSAMVYDELTGLLDKLQAAQEALRSRVLPVIG